MLPLRRFVRTLAVDMVVAVFPAAGRWIVRVCRADEQGPSQAGQAEALMSGSIGGRSEQEDRSMQNMPDPAGPPQPPPPSGYALLQQDQAGHDRGESAELFDWALIGSYAIFVFHSIWRHKLLFLLVWGGIIAFSLGLMFVLPKTYQVKTTLQAQRNQVMASLSNPSRAIPMDADAPTRLAAETVQRYDNLVALVKQTDLVKNWPLRRAPLLKLKDAIWRVLFRAPTPEEQVENFVFYLQNRLWVTTGEGTVTIGIEFPDPQLAYRLVDTALQNFLEARHAADVSSIAEAITLLEGRAEQAHQTLAAALQQLQNVRATRQGKRVSKSAVDKGPEPIDSETSRLLITIQSKRRAIADLEEFRRRRITELQTRLQEQRANYSASHPAVLDTEQSLEAVRRESPQVAVLKREQAALEAEVKKAGIADPNAQEMGRATPLILQAERLGPLDPREDEDPQVGYAREQVRFALANYNSFLDRIEGARLELDSARAAFKYRYTIITPVQRPRGPIKPKPTLVLAGSLIAGLVLAIFSATLVDLHSRKLLENWQIERQLKVPLLAEVRSK
jgi:hypothetical protein